VKLFIILLSFLLDIEKIENNDMLKSFRIHFSQNQHFEQYTIQF